MRVIDCAITSAWPRAASKRSIARRGLFWVEVQLWTTWASCGALSILSSRVYWESMPVSTSSWPFPLLKVRVSTNNRFLIYFNSIRLSRHLHSASSRHRIALCRRSTQFDCARAFATIEGAGWSGRHGKDRTRSFCQNEKSPGPCVQRVSRIWWRQTCVERGNALFHRFKSPPANVCPSVLYRKRNEWRAYCQGSCEIGHEWQNVCGDVASWRVVEAETKGKWAYVFINSGILAGLL